MLNAIVPDIKSAASSLLGANNASIYLVYYYLLDLVFIVILYAGIIEILRSRDLGPRRFISYPSGSSGSPFG